MKLTVATAALALCLSPTAEARIGGSSFPDRQLTENECVRQCSPAQRASGANCCPNRKLQSENIDGNEQSENLSLNSQPISSERDDVRPAARKLGAGCAPGERYC